MEALQTIPRAEEFFALIQDRLKPKTLHHVLGVTELMLHVAPEIGISLEDAAAAGLLHDSCKYMNPQQLLEAAAEYAIPVNDAQRAKPALLHGPVAAEEAKRDLGVESDAVYEAIYWHTTGKPGSRSASAKRSISPTFPSRTARTQAAPKPARNGKHTASKPRSCTPPMLNWRTSNPRQTSIP
jgi:hypothetical protein